MSWTDLNQPTLFLQQPNVAYPESHSMVAFLVEQHGVGGINRLIDAVGQGQTMESAIQTAYGLSSNALEKDWQGSIPEVIRTGLPRNVLDDGSLRRLSRRRQSNVGQTPLDSPESPSNSGIRWATDRTPLKLGRWLTLQIQW